MVNNVDPMGIYIKRQFGTHCINLIRTHPPLFVAHAYNTNLEIGVVRCCTRRKNISMKKQGWEPIHTKYKANKSTKTLVNK
jgi:hypothetical protein